MVSSVEPSDSTTLREALKATAVGQLKVMPEVTMMVGSLFAGMFLIFAEIDFHDPLGPAWIGILAFRVLGWAFLLAPLAVMWKNARGDDD